MRQTATRSMAARMEYATTGVLVILLDMICKDSTPRPMSVVITDKRLRRVARIILRRRGIRL